MQERARLTVERILDAAAHVFGERGYAATTNQVAESAGVSIGSLYQYFPDKDAILIALHSRHLDAIERELIGRGPTSDPSAWLRWLVDQLVDLNLQADARLLWDVSRMVPTMRGRISSLVDHLARDAASAIDAHGPLHARAVVVTALAVAHELVLPIPTPARRRAAHAAVHAVASASAA